MRATACTARIGERVLLHFLAGHAPVRIEIEHHRPARGLCRGELALEIRDALDALESDAGVFRGRAARARRGSEQAVDAGQRLQRIAATRQRADQQQRAVDDDRARRSRDARRSMPCRMSRPPSVSRQKPATNASAAQSAERDGAGQQAADHPDRDAEHHHAEHLLDRVHPGAGFRQELARRRADEQQRGAHAEAQREQRRAAAEHVAALPDHGQRRDERRCDAGRHDQRRQRAHDGRADQRALLLLVAEASRRATAATPAPAC